MTDLKNMYQLVKKMFPIHRSITGDGNRETLKYIKKIIPIKIKEVPTGTKAFDWKIPLEWKITKAYIKDSKGNTIIDIKNNNLHILSYSRPFKGKIKFKELNKHLYYLKDFPNWIPYRTSYYKDTWGFCLTYNQYKNLNRNETYDVCVDANLFKGSLTYGELIIKGKSKKELLFSTYICHPSMCNDNLSGPVVATYLAKYILKNMNNFYTYRFVFIPESIGSIAYLKKNLKQMKKNTIGGYVLVCLGDAGDFTYLQTRKEKQITDKVSIFALKETKVNYKLRKFHTCGSDERQYNFPGVDLNIGSLMRTKYFEYDEYHTSADNLKFISQNNLEKSYKMYLNCINIFENNHKYYNKTLCEPRLGIHGMWNQIGASKSKEDINMIFRKILYYCDGKNDIIDICKILDKPFEKINNAIKLMLKKKIILKNLKIISKGTQ